MSETNGVAPESMERRQFMKDVVRAGLGAVIAGSAAEGVSAIVPDVEKAADQSSADTKQERPETYAMSIENAIRNGLGDAYEEVAGKSIDARDKGEKVAAVGLVAGAALTAAQGATGEAPSANKNPIDVLAEKVAPFAAYGAGGVIPGVVRMESADSEHDKVYGQYVVLLRQVDDGLKELSRFDSFPVADQQRVQSTARKCLLELGLEDFDVTDFNSIRTAAKQFALSRMRV